MFANVTGDWHVAFETNGMSGQPFAISYTATGTIQSTAIAVRSSSPSSDKPRLCRRRHSAGRVRALLGH